MLDVAVSRCSLPFVQARHDVGISHASWSCRHDVVLVVQREVVENIGIDFAVWSFGIAVHAIEAVLDNRGNFVGEGWVVRLTCGHR